MRMAESTAWRLSTGNDPGSPRHTGHTLVLGSSPKALRQPQNSLVAVRSSQWTSSPITISQSDSAIDGLLLAGGGPFEGGGHAEHQRLLQRRRQHLHADG